MMKPKHLLTWQEPQFFHCLPVLSANSRQLAVVCLAAFDAGHLYVGLPG
jgi:hypothetical protein